jgi:RES domain-containing protein
MRVCPSCFGESHTLKQHCESEGQLGTCPTCGEGASYVVDAQSLDDLFRGLEEHYEPLCGNAYELGKNAIYGIDDPSLVEVLREQWEVFSDGITDDQAEQILAAIWPDYSGEYMKSPSDRWNKVDGWLEELRSLVAQSIEHPDPLALAKADIRSRLFAWVEVLATPLTIRSWKRARRQTAKGLVWPASQMTGPPDKDAPAQRANPLGKAMLYVASDADTALAESRAKPGDWVTVATMEIEQRHAVVLDLTRVRKVIDPFAQGDLEEALMVRSLLEGFGRELSRPVDPARSDIEYVHTQALCQYFCDQGFDGILYPSSRSTGHNAVFFRPQVAAVIDRVERGV